MKALGWWDAEAELCELYKHKAVIAASYEKSRALGEHYHRLAHELSPLWRRQRDTLLEKAEHHDKGTAELEEEMAAVDKKIHRRMNDQRSRAMSAVESFATSAAKPICHFMSDIMGKGFRVGSWARYQGEELLKKVAGLCNKVKQAVGWSAQVIGKLVPDCSGYFADPEYREHLPVLAVTFGVLVVTGGIFKTIFDSTKGYP